MKRGLSVLTLAAATTLSANAFGGSSRECIDAASRAQLERDEGKLVQARKDLLVCATSACPAPIRADCTQWLEDVDKRIPTVVLRASDAKGADLPDVTVLVDGAPAPRAEGGAVPLDIGPHVIRFERAGFRPVEQTVTLAASEKARPVSVTMERAVELAAAPASAAPARKIPVGSWIGWGVGAAGLVGFGIFGLKANLDYGSLKDTCGGACDPSERDALKTTMVIADVSLVIGLVGAGVGTVLYLMQPGASRTGRVDLTPGGAF